MPIGVNEEDINFRKSVITFMRNIDPGNEFGYKELTRLWIAEKGHPQTSGERTILKEVAKNHTYGKPQKCEPTPPPTPSSPKSASSVSLNSVNDFSYLLRSVSIFYPLMKLLIYHSILATKQKICVQEESCCCSS